MPRVGYASIPSVHVWASLALEQCIPEEWLWWVQSFSSLLPPNSMCCGSNLKLQGSILGKENSYDLGNATTRWHVPDGCGTVFDLWSGGSWWFSTQATGRKTPSAPSWPSPPLLLISGEIFFGFLFWGVSELYIFSQAGCCIYACSTDGLASHHAWARLSVIHFALCKK